jgi:hypothetical protein
MQWKELNIGVAAQQFDAANAFNTMSTCDGTKH